MLMMQATGASIISIIGGRFSNLTSSGTPATSKKWCSGPDGPRRLVFKTARAHDAHFGGLNGPPKCLTNPSVAWGFASKTHVNFGVVLEGGPGGPLEKRRSNHAGSAALASAPWRSQGHGLRQQLQGVARGVTPMPPTLCLEALQACFWGKRLRQASPSGTEGFGHEILGQHHQLNWAFVSHFWPPQHI